MSHAALQTLTCGANYRSHPMADRNLRPCIFCGDKRSCYVCELETKLEKYEDNVNYLKHEIATRDENLKRVEMERGKVIDALRVEVHQTEEMARMEIRASSLKSDHYAAELATSQERERVLLAFADAYAAWAATPAETTEEIEMLCKMTAAYAPVEKMRAALGEGE